MREHKTKTKTSEIKILLRLYSLFAVHNKSTIIFCVLTSIFTGVRPYIMVVLSGILIDGLVSGKDYKQLLIYLGVGFALNFVAQLIEAALRESFNSRVENCLERQNMDMNEQSMKLDYEIMENPEIQEKKRKQEQVVNLWGGLYWFLIWPLDKGLSGTISVITAFIVSGRLFTSGIGDSNPWFTLFSIILLLVIILCSWGSFKNNNFWNHKERILTDKYASEKKKSNYLLHGVLSSADAGKDLRIFNQKELISDCAVMDHQAKSFKLLKKIRIQSMKQEGISGFLSTITFSSVYFYAAIKAFYGLISIGSVVKYSQGIMKCINGIFDILICTSGWKRAVDYGRDYLEYIDCLSTKNSGTEPLERKEDGILLECDHVSFCYPGTTQYVIQNLNLTLNFKPGDHIAIVGRNGSGKTTFIKLLCRLYDVTEGEIRINGKNIKEYSYEDYLDLFAVVFQDYKLFSLMLGETLASSTEVDEGKIWDAMNKAGLADKMQELSDGINTYIGKEFETSGVNFSGGERQKLAIARAVYKNAQFVIMDEPTAALDPISECDVYEGFSRLVGEKAAIYISHRLASCRFCERIIVFEAGRIIQNGSHDDLITEEGLYRKLWNAQAQYYQK
jgi:ATP-binding cassette subfamily B protein